MELLNVELVVSIRRESYLRVYLIGFADYDDLRHRPQGKSYTIR